MGFWGFGKRKAKLLQLGFYEHLVPPFLVFVGLGTRLSQPYSLGCLEGVFSHTETVLPVSRILGNSQGMRVYGGFSQEAAHYIL